MFSCQKAFIFILLIFLSACSDHKTGYTDGYSGEDAKQWFVFGRADYAKGYQLGKADKFQDDWLAENPLKENIKFCPQPRVETDISTFLPTGYSNITSDIYSQ